MQSFIKKYSLWLLLLAGVLTVAADYLKDSPHPKTTSLTNQPAPATPAPESQEHTHSDSDSPPKHDHGAMSAEAKGLSKEEREKRMGIFHYNEANAFLKKGNAEEAVVHYKMALHHASTLPEIHLNLSTAYFRLKDFDKARDTLKDLEAISPDLPALHYNLACYHSLTGHLPEALKSVQQAFQSGKIKKESISKDPDLEALRSDPAFRQWFESLLDHPGEG